MQREFFLKKILIWFGVALYDLYRTVETSRKKQSYERFSPTILQIAVSWCNPNYHSLS